MVWITMKDAEKGRCENIRLNKIQEVTGAYHYEMESLNFPDRVVKCFLDAPLVVRGPIKAKAFEAKYTVRATLIQAQEDIKIKDGDLYTANTVEAGGNIEVNGFICARQVVAGGDIYTDMAIHAASVRAHATKM